ncbi:MAG TPA: pilus assembly protein TadG-related protein [Erythrobacter sp.]|nr:pilus assembly protein TadG-related protein [Erythrobacter sp.]
MGRQTQHRKTFLRSLLHDKTANTIAIAAAALFPILAMVGGGIDASRYYMAASRLQAACDAGALAARRAMITDDFEAEHRQVGLNFFDQNYVDGMFGSNSLARDYTSDGSGRVDGTASATMPTSIMSIFGFDELDLTANCSAEINISNTDIMFVLDVTGSMNCPDTNPGCGNNGNVEASNALIVGLRDAVMSFYDTVEDATSDTAQVRYGVVPYAPNVNVGFQIPREYMANTHTYQSRFARFHFVNEWQTVSDQTEWLPRLVGNFGSTNNDHYRFANRTNDPGRRDDNDYNRCEAMSGNTYTQTNVRYQVLSDEYVLNVWEGGNVNLRAGCRGRVIKQELRSVNRLRDYIYCAITPGSATQCGNTNPAGSPAGWETVDLATLYDDNRIDMPIGVGGTMQTVTWAGCIEEAASVATGTWNPVNASAFDLDINLRPATEAQRWKPALPEAYWRRYDSNRARTRSNVVTTNTNGYQATGDSGRGNTEAHDCPAQARRLGEITRADLRTYVDGLRARGSTYHDIGMIWGARFISPRGIFRADNETAPNGDAIGRHIVFMTDGLLEPNIDQYGTYGVEWWDRRVTNDGSTDVAARHAARFQAACRAARNENITVWTISFGRPLEDNLIDCASPGRAYQADNNAELEAAFQEIAQKIAALRLTQ